MAGETYDIGLTNGTNTLSAMCALRDGYKLYKVGDIPMIPESVMTSAAEPSVMSPDRKIQVTQNDWRRGFQQLNFDDPYMYSKGANVDARYEGRVILSPKELTAMTYPSYTTSTITDGGLENWTGDVIDSPWIEAGSGVTNDQANERSGSNCAMRDPGVATRTGSIYQALSWSNDYRGDVFCVQAWFKTDVQHADTWGKITLYDGVNTVITDACYGNSTAWTPMIASILIDAAATELKVTISYSVHVDSIIYLDDVTKLAQDNDGSVTKIKQFGSDIVIASGKSLYKVSSGALVWLATFPAAITDLCVFTATTEDPAINRLYIAQGWSANYWYTDDLGAFMYCTLANSAAKHMANIGGGYQFWISDSNSTMRSTALPYNGGTAFSGTYQIRDDDYDITGLLDNEEGTVYCRKQNNIYYLSGSDVLELIPELEAESSTSIDYPLYMWQGKLYIAAGVNGLYEYDNGTVTILSPSYFVNTITLSGGFGAGASDFDEEVLAICGDAHFLYMAIANGTTVEVLSGSWKTVQGVYDWYWHTLYELTNNDWTSMLISSADSSVKRLYVGTDTVGDGIKKFIVPITYSDVLVESNYEVESTGDFYTPWFRSNFPTENKYWQTVSVTAICVTDKTSIGVHYQKKGDTTWTDLGDCTPQALVSGDYPPENTSTFNIRIESERIRFKFVLAAADDDYSPILFGLGGGIGITGILTAEKIRLVDFTLYIATKWRERTAGTVMSRTISTDLTACRALYTTSSKPITVTGPDSTAYTGFFYREGYEEQLIYDPVGRSEAWEVRMRIVERYDA